MTNMYNQLDRLNWQPLSFRDLESSILPELRKTSSIEQVDEYELTPETDSNLLALNQDSVVNQQMLEDIKQEVTAQAYEEGFNLGKISGFDAGKEAGYEQGFILGQQEGRQRVEQQLSDEKLKAVQVITALISNFQQSINDIDELIVPKLFDLALLAAQKTVGTISKVKQKQLIFTIQMLTEQCSMLSGPISVHLNPNDLQWLGPMLTEEIKQYHWQLIADPNIEIGGCKIFTNTNEIDSNITDHWQIMADCLYER